MRGPVVVDVIQAQELDRPLAAAYALDVPLAVVEQRRVPVLV
jgi:hypothetical protein